jgi:thiol-disulfide isomerase/thioredoxin
METGAKSNKKKVRSVKRSNAVRGTKKHPADNKPDVAMVKVYADWCGHCKTLAPQWEQMEAHLKHRCRKSGHNVLVLGVNSENIPAGMMQVKRATGVDLPQNVVGYPTIYRIIGNKVDQYEGPRDAIPMADWAQSGLLKMGGKGKRNTQKRKRKYFFGLF